MGLMGVYYFHVVYGYEEENKWHKRHEYGFVQAQDFVEATRQIANSFRSDLLSLKLEEIGDDLISTENEEIAKAFKKSFIKTHYGEDEEDE